MSLLPCLDEPPEGAACPVCAEALRIWRPGYCGACGWREDEELLEALEAA
jgi:hypothetical protein